MLVKTYVKYFLYLNIGLISLVLIANILIDTQGILNMPRLEKVNKHVVINNDSGRLISSINLQKNQYETIIIGTSRTQSGIDPRSKVFVTPKVYNASLGDTEVYEQILQLEYILKYQEELKHLVFGLDFHTFSSHRQIKSQFYDSLFNEKITYIDAVSNYFLSYQSLQDIYTTVVENQKDEIDSYWIGSYYNSKGHNKFQKHMTNILKFYMSDDSMFGCFEYEDKRMHRLQEVLTKFAQRGVKVSLFISPQHAKNLLMLKYLQLDSQYRAWAFSLNSMKESINSEAKGFISLWDFSGFNVITTEKISKDKKFLKYYFETSHYKQNVGDYIIQTLENDKQAYEGFGVRLSNKNIVNHMDMLQKNQLNYVKTHTDEVEDLVYLINETKVQRDTLECY